MHLFWVQKGFIYMKWLLILGVIFFAYSYFSNDKKSNSLETVQYSAPQQVTSVSHSQPAPVQPSHNFKCDGREYCSQMTSKADTEFFILNCYQSSQVINNMLKRFPF